MGNPEPNSAITRSSSEIRGSKQQDRSRSRAHPDPSERKPCRRRCQRPSFRSLLTLPHQLHLTGEPIAQLSSWAWLTISMPVPGFTSIRLPELGSSIPWKKGLTIRLVPLHGGLSVKTFVHDEQQQFGKHLRT